jgi:acetylornithine deacetylase/succinyl-diaminopimelate desuccinylase-like protein
LHQIADTALAPCPVCGASFGDHTISHARTQTHHEKHSITAEWDASITQIISDYIEIPNQSPLFDPEWKTNGYQEQAVELFVNWVKTQTVAGLKMRVEHDKDRTPLIFIEIDATDGSDATVLMYGHLDKQPPLTEDWNEGLGPWKPVLRDGKLYGRGGADDGYSLFAAIMSVRVCQEQNVPHSRVVIVIEGCEESGSPDLPYYVDKLKADIGEPALVICLDSGCGNYEQLWLTTSLRGIVVGNLRVKLISEGVHSGAASGVVPDTFRVMRLLLDKIEDATTGQMKLPELFCDIPKKFADYAKHSAETLGDGIHTAMPFLDGVKPADSDNVELALNKTWRPTLTVTGADGLPSLPSAGNVVRKETAIKLSIRLPPFVEPKPAIAALKKVLENDTPYG